MTVEFGVLGSVTAWATTGESAGETIALKGPRHRAVLARLLVARGRSVPLTMLIDDLWHDPPADAVGSVRTFVGSLRRALEPERAPRATPRLLVTEGAGYALRAQPDAIDATRFEQAVEAATALRPHETAKSLERALAWWRGPAYADFGDALWARAERSRLTELRLHAVEVQAAARLESGRAADAVPDLDAHVAEHPWREEGWRLLALALYRSGRQIEALDAVRRARAVLTEQFGVDPGGELNSLELDILRHADRLDLRSGADAPVPTAAHVWEHAAETYNRTVASGTRARLRSTVELLRSLAVTGGSGLDAARQQRLSTITAAEELGDSLLTAQVIGAYDVPAIWSRSDDPPQAAQIVAAAERTLARLGPGALEVTRARLLTTIALESRGDGTSGCDAHSRGRRAAEEAEQIARRIDDPALLAFALNGKFMQSFWRTGLAPQRDAIGVELIAVSSRHGLATSEILGHLVRLQALSALGELTQAETHAAAADRLATEYESPLVAVFTAWFAALRLAMTDHDPVQIASAYRRAAARLDGAGMPGLQNGLVPLRLLALRVRNGQPAQTEEEIDWGPYEPWARPLVLLARQRPGEAATAVRALPDPPPDHLLEALWCLNARAAVAVDDRDMMQRALTALGPAEAEFAGAASGLFTLGPVSRYLDELTQALRRTR